MKESLDSLQELAKDNIQETKPLFDPEEFKRNNPAPTIEEFKLEDSILKHWAIEGSEIRAKLRN